MWSSVERLPPVQNISESIIVGTCIAPYLQCRILKIFVTFLEILEHYFKQNPVIQFKIKQNSSIDLFDLVILVFERQRHIYNAILGSFDLCRLALEVGFILKCINVSNKADSFIMCLICSYPDLQFQSIKVKFFREQWCNQDLHLGGMRLAWSWTHFSLQ